MVKKPKKLNGLIDVFAAVPRKVVTIAAIEGFARAQSLNPGCLTLRHLQHDLAAGVALLKRAVGFGEPVQFEHPVDVHPDVA